MQRLRDYAMFLYDMYGYTEAEAVRSSCSSTVGTGRGKLYPKKLTSPRKKKKS
jgi:hypothetical protein